MSAELTMRGFDLPLGEGFETASARIASRRGFAIRIRTPTGIGIGEATPLSSWTESYEDCRAALGRAGEVIADTEPWRMALPAERPAARHGLQLAVMDLSARTAGHSLARYLGGRDRSRRVPVNATIGDGDLETTVTAAERAVAAGFETVKCKVGARALHEDIRRVRSVREAIGEEPDLRLDANRSWTIAETRSVFEELAENDVTYVEEPLDDPSIDAIERVRDGSTGIALDETISRTEDVSGWLDVIDAVVVKPMALGGIDRAIEIAAAARRTAVETVVSTTVDAVIARSAAVHLAAALPGRQAAGLATGELLATDLADDPVPVGNGRIEVPDTPGIGTLGPWDVTARGSA